MIFDVEQNTIASDLPPALEVPKQERVIDSSNDDEETAKEDESATYVPKDQNKLQIDEYTYMNILRTTSAPVPNLPSSRSQNGKNHFIFNDQQVPFSNKVLSG